MTTTTRRRGSGWWWVLAGLCAGCIGTNPAWDGPATEGWVPPAGTRCSGAGDASTESSGGTTDAGSGTDHRQDDACAVVEPDPGVCGDRLEACASEGGWFCADLRSHDEHCGACFHDCAAYGDARCEAGECRCAGGPWWRVCWLGCTDTRRDPMGCGAHCLDCRLTYGPDARCEDGVCGPGGGE
jgi:hypothetical protein